MEKREMERSAGAEATVVGSGAAGVAVVGVAVVGEGSDGGCGEGAVWGR